MARIRSGPLAGYQEEARFNCKLHQFAQICDLHGQFAGPLCLCCSIDLLNAVVIPLLLHKF
jgi:hypothetical protein